MVCESGGAARRTWRGRGIKLKKKKEQKKEVRFAKSPPGGEVMHGRAYLKTRSRSNKFASSHVAAEIMGLPPTTGTSQAPAGDYKPTRGTVGLSFFLGGGVGATGGGSSVRLRIQQTDRLSVCLS